MDRDEKGRFVKGNKEGKGRIKGSFSINDELRRLLSTKDAKTKRKYVEVLASKIFTEALKGNDRLLVEMWQQMEGRPKQQVDVDANIRQRGEMIVIDASGKQLEDDESPLDEDNSKS